MSRKLRNGLIGAAAIVAAGPALAESGRAAMATKSAAMDFETAEHERLAAASENDVEALTALARFYLKHGLQVEALATIRRAAAPTPALRLIADECDYRLGRYRAIVARVAPGGSGNSFHSMALVRLGAYEDARAAFEKADATASPAGFKSDFELARAEALAEIGDLEDAASALRRADPDFDKQRRDYIAARILALRGDRSRAGGIFRRAAAGEKTQWSMRARLALAQESRDEAALRSLDLEWRGGAFERDLMRALGALALEEGDYRSGINALALIVDRHSESDAARKAQEEIAGALPRLLADPKLAPKEAAEIFFEHVEFAPPGREGDALIHEAANKLEALGLFQQAAQLLDHQVFKRLRNGARAATAADLASLYLKAEKPADALRTLRSTRIAGLPAEINQRRRRLEAEALAASGDSEGAVALLSVSPSIEDLRLRGAINWSRKLWTASAADYASYVAAAPALDDPSGREAAVRAATAFLLAGDRAGYRAFSKEALARLEGLPEANLIRSLGDVDREQFLATFMASYKSVYGGG